MKFQILISLLIGAAIGAAATVWWGGREPPAESVAAPSASESPRAELERLRARVAEQDSELMEATLRAVTLQNQLADLREIEPSDVERGNASERREDRFRAYREDGLRREFNEFSAVVNLAPGQRDAVEAALRQRQEARIAAWEARRNGEPFVPPQNHFDALLNSILNPQQLDQYRAYEEAATASRLETGATARMNRVAPRLGLTEDQKDEVFAAYHQDLQRWSDETAAISEMDRKAVLVERMRGILTPEQFASWQELEGDRQGARGPRGFGF